MGQTSRGYSYPDDYNQEADVPKDIKKLAEDVDSDITNLEKGLKQEISDVPQYDDTGIKSSISDIEAKNRTQDTSIETNTTDISNLKEEDTKINEKIVELKDKSGNKLKLEINPTTYVMTIKLLNQDDTELDSQDIDFPLESMVVGGRFDKESETIVLTLQNKEEVSFSVASLVNGLINKETFDNTVKDLQGKIDDCVKTTDFQKSQEEQNTNIEKNTKEIQKLQEEITNSNVTRGHVYTIRRKISANTATTWERLDDAKGMVANATKNGGVVQNDFDNVSPWKDIISFNLDLTTGKKKAYFGDADFKFNGENGDVYTYIPTFWYKIWEENDYMYASIADYARSGYIEIKEFDIARYHGSVTGDGKIHSYSGLIPSYNKTLPAFRTLAQTLGDDYCLLDWRYFAIQLLYLVEYANYNSQTILGNGMTSLRVNNADVALVAGNSTNKFVVNTSGGNAFIVGQTISIGTNGNGNFGVAEGRKITAITDYDQESIVGKEITFDGDPVNIALTNVIWSSVQREGDCDTLGMKSGCKVNDGKHGVIYRGIENPFGNIYSWVDGLNINEYQAYVCYDPESYACDKYEAPYEQLGYVNANADGWTKNLGFDINHPLIQLPAEIGANNSTGTADYYYRNTGKRVALVGGGVISGSNAGLWYWFLSAASSSAGWAVGARVLKYQ